MQDERDSEAQPSIAPMVFFETCKSPEAATTVFDAQEYSSERNRSGFLRRQVPDDEPEEDSADDEEPRVRSAERGGAAKNEEHFLCLVPVEKDVSCSSDVFPSLDGVHVSNLLGSDSSPGGSESGVGTPCARMPISPYLPNQREAGGKTMVCTAVQTDGEFPQNPKQNPKPEPKPLVIGENTKSNTQLTAVEHGLTNTRPSVNSGEPRPESPQADGGGMEITELAFSNNNLEYSGLVATIERASDVGSERRSADDHSGNMGDSVARAVVDDEVMEDELLASGSETYDDGAISPSAILQCSSEPKMGDTSTSGGIAGTVGNASAETGEHGADHSPTVLLFSAQRKMVDSTPGCCTTSAVDSASTDGVKERSSVQPTTVQADCNTLGRERGASEHENDHGDLRSGGYIGQKAVALDDDESIDIASPSLKCLTTVDEVTRDMQKMLREDAAQEDGGLMLHLQITTFLSFSQFMTLEPMILRRDEGQRRGCCFRTKYRQSLASYTFRLSSFTSISASRGPSSTSCSTAIAPPKTRPRREISYLAHATCGPRARRSVGRIFSDVETTTAVNNTRCDTARLSAGAVLLFEVDHCHVCA